MDKSNHLVTVPRVYLEELESVFAERKKNKFRASVIVAVYPPSESSPDGRKERTLFIEEGNGVSADVASVIIVNSDGKELGVFTKRVLS